ncbi:MAG: DUF3303 domain-containing protein [archaeon]
MLLTWEWSPENAREVTARFREWKPEGKYKTLYPISTIIGCNKGFGVVDVDDIAELEKDLSQWTDLITYTLSPCMDSRDAVAVAVAE